MFLSVKERARQIASGQFQSPLDTTSTPVQPPPSTPKVVPSKTVTAKFSPSKGPSPKTAPPPSTPKKSESPKTPSTPKISSTPAWKATAPKTPSSKTTSSKEKSSKSSSARASSPKASSSKSSSSKSSSSKTSPKIAPSKPKLTRSKTSADIAPLKLATPKLTRSKTSADIGIGSFADDPPEDVTTISGLKAACLKQASAVTGLGGRNLAVNLKQTSSGEWYAALKDLGSDKYLKMWMNRSKTFPTQIEALEAYLVFAKKMKAECRLFPPMSPKATKSK